MRRPRGWLFLLACAGCAHLPPPAAPLEPPPPAVAPAPALAPPPVAQSGYATWYGRRFAGRRTANGERFDPTRMTAAHLTLPFGTWVEVTRVDTGQRVRVRITDRGPYGSASRIIDLSEAAARELDMLRSGVAEVELRIVEGP